MGEQSLPAAQECASSQRSPTVPARSCCDSKPPHFPVPAWTRLILSPITATPELTPVFAGLVAPVSPWSSLSPPCHGGRLVGMRSSGIS